jgi:uncharacterized protein (DUF1499 family)
MTRTFQEPLAEFFFFFFFRLSYAVECCILAIMTCTTEHHSSSAKQLSRTAFMLFLTLTQKHAQALQTATTAAAATTQSAQLTRSAVLHNLTAAAAGIASMAALHSATAAQAEELGVNDDLFALCPPTPTCVSSQDDRADTFAAPWAYEVSTARAMQLVADYVGFMAGASIVAKTDRYLRATVSSIGATDDLEFYMTPGDYTVQFRANRRDGFTDLGQNRRRMEAMRIALGFEQVRPLTSLHLQHACREGIF